MRANSLMIGGLLVAMTLSTADGAACELHGNVCLQADALQKDWGHPDLPEWLPKPLEGGEFHYAAPKLLIQAPGSQTPFGRDVASGLIRAAAMPSGSNANSDAVTDIGDVALLARPIPVLRLNTGGPAVGNFVSDEGYFTGGQVSTTSTVVAGTSQPELYQTERFAPAGEAMSYEVAVDPGQYRVRLHFAETFHTAPGQRVFSVQVEHLLAVQNLDIFAEAGANAALVREVQLGVYDGHLNISFLPGIENPKINAIEILAERNQGHNGQLVYLVNAGGDAFTDRFGRNWEPDDAYANGGTKAQIGTEVAGTDMDPIYLTERWFDTGAGTWSFPVEPGRYAVRLHFAEIFHDTPGNRVMSVKVEHLLYQNQLDILAFVPKFHSMAFEAQVDSVDGFLDVALSPIVGDPKVSGIEIYRLKTYAATFSPTTYSWPNTALGGRSENLFVRLANPTSEPLKIQHLFFDLRIGNGRDIHLSLGGHHFTGGVGDLLYPVDITVPANTTLTGTLYFEPTRESENYLALYVAGTFPTQLVELSAVSGGHGHEGHPFLHVVVQGDLQMIDFDGDNRETVTLSGRASHTHELGHSIVAYEWTDHHGAVLGTGEELILDLPVGEHHIGLKIFDDNVPPDTLDGHVTVKVLGPDQIPGPIALYAISRGTPPEFMIFDPPAKSDYAERMADYTVNTQNGRIGSTPYTENVLVRLVGKVQVKEAGSYRFQATGGAAQLILVNGAPAEGAVNLQAGLVDVEARFGVQNAGQLPVQLHWAKDSGQFAAIPADFIRHSETALRPVINSMPTEGNPAGGNRVEIRGLGFFPPSQVVVNWGNIQLSGAALDIDGDLIALTAPAGQGIFQVTVVTPNGESNSIAYEYTEDAKLPVAFNNPVKMAGIWGPVQAEFGPDGRLYVATLQENMKGYINVYTLDDNYNVVGQPQVIDAISKLPNSQILGLGFNPHLGADPVVIYVGHASLFAHNNGFCFSGFSPYSGQVSALVGPNFDTVYPIITHLPVSNHDHGVNGIQFDNDGTMYVAIGGNTNAGVPGCNIGGLPESPFSGAIIKAPVMKPGFNGDVRYVNPGTEVENMDQTNGGFVDVKQGVDVSVFGAGLRNPFDLVFTTKDRIYATDNGADPGFGNVSTGPFSETTAVPDAHDELNYIQEGHYYGHPNRNRGRADGRQNVYHDPWKPQNGSFTQSMTNFGYSTNGIVEYRANTFGGTMRGELLAQVYNNELVRMKLADDGTWVTNRSNLFGSGSGIGGLDVTTGPGGAIIVADYNGASLKVALPKHTGLVGMHVYDIFPWRANAVGGAPFVIGGINFNPSAASTRVLFGDKEAVVTSVSGNRVRGIIPAYGNPPEDLLTVTVIQDGVAAPLGQAFRYVGNGIVDTGARASVEIDPGGGMNESSTYNGGSFKINNTSANGQKITAVTFDFTTAIYPDIVFDPYASAGDWVGKNFTLDFNGTNSSVQNTFWMPKDGGFQALTLNFGGFDAGEAVNFSVDVDPTTINGSGPPGPNHSGSISGMEAIGTSVRVHFSDGSEYVTRLYRKPNSLTGANNIAKTIKAPTPSIQALGHGGDYVNTSDGQVTIRVFGQPGAAMNVLHQEAGLYVNGVPGGGFDIDPFESNTVIFVDERFPTIGPEGYVDETFTLRKTDSSAGYNVFVAVARDVDGSYSDVSNVVLLKKN